MQSTVHISSGIQPEKYMPGTIPGDFLNFRERCNWRDNHILVNIAKDYITGLCVDFHKVFRRLWISINCVIYMSVCMAITAPFPYVYCVWINAWVNNRETGDLRRYSAHYGVTVMRLHLPAVLSFRVFGNMTFSVFSKWKRHAPANHCLKHNTDTLSPAFWKIVFDEHRLRKTWYTPWCANIGVVLFRCWYSSACLKGSRFQAICMDNVGYRIW